VAGAGGQIVQAGERRSSKIESLRAIGGLGVLAGHIFGQSRHYQPSQTMNTYLHRLLFGGGLGNFIFFALSGYLLFWPFAKRWFASGPPVDLRRYAWNRVLRILPLYFISVIVFMIFVDHGGTWNTWWRFLTMTENFSSRTLGTLDGPMWAVTVEVCFYILLPILAFSVAKLSGGSRVSAAIILVLLGFGSWLLDEHAVGGAVRRPMLQYSIAATFMFYVPGLLLALLRLHWTEKPPRWLKGPLGNSSLWLAAAVAFFLLQVADYSRVEIINIATFLGIGACVLPVRPGRLTRALEWRWLALLGAMSYSLNIWHDPITVWLSGLPGILGTYKAQIVIAGGASLAVAVVSYYLIEVRFLRLRRPWTSGRPAASAAPTAEADSLGPAGEAA
jgi:peptidoglycan/LPS O-acetylase OafA/YrhL